MSRTTNALVRAMTQRRNSRPVAIEGDFAQAIARQLESRGIARVPGLPAEPEPQWFDTAIEHLRRQQELAAEREARRRAEGAAEEKRRRPGLPNILMSEIAKTATPGRSSAPIPLNGAAVLRAALNGGPGTTKGGNF